MADAVLSDGSELLLERRDVDASDNTHDDEQCSPHEHSSTNINCDRTFQLEQPLEHNAPQKRSPESVQQDDRNRFVIRRDNRPAYQRRSHDDRQLPPVVSIDREIPWYQNCVTPSSSVLANNNSHQTPVANIPDNNNVLRSPPATSSAKSISSSATPSSPTPVRKKVQHSSGIASVNNIEQQQQHQQQRRFSKKVSVSGRRGAKMSSSSAFDIEYSKHQSPTLSNGEDEFSSRKMTFNDRSPSATGEPGHKSYFENVNNNNTSSKLSDSNHTEKHDDYTQSTTNTTSAAYRKFSSNKKRTSRHSRDSSG